MKNFIKKSKSELAENGVIGGSIEIHKEIKRGLWRLYYGGELIDWIKWYLNFDNPVIDARCVSAEIPAESFMVYHMAENHVERHLIHEFMRFVKEDDVFWDVGANYGSWSVLVGQEVGEVVCFEPDERVGKHLKNNLTHNDIEFEYNDFGLSNREETVELSINHRIGVDPVKLTFSRADDVIDLLGVSPPNIMKIDVEGFEGKVIEGFGDYLPDIRRILIEVHPEKMNGEWSDESLIEHLSQTHNINVVYDRINQYHIEGVKK